MLVDVVAKKRDSFLALREGRAVDGFAVYTGIFLMLFFMGAGGEAQGEQAAESNDFFHQNKLKLRLFSTRPRRFRDSTEIPDNSTFFARNRIKQEETVSARKNYVARVGSPSRVFSVADCDPRRAGIEIQDRNLESAASNIECN